MKTIQKLILCLGLATLISAPLAGCSSTWNGVKNDWHDMTGSSDSSSDNTTASAAPAQTVQPTQAVAPAQTSAPAQKETTLHSQTTTTTTYNR